MRRVAVFWLVALSVWVAAPAVRAEDSEAKAELIKEGEESAGVLKAKEGLRLNLPDDWPVQKRGTGRIPVTIEEYLVRKFGAMDKRIQRLEQQFTATDLRLRVMEEELKKQQQQLKSTEKEP